MSLELLQTLSKVWPKEYPLPTLGQVEQALSRYNKENQDFIDQGGSPSSDWFCGLSFVVATYNPTVWKDLFDL